MANRILEILQCETELSLNDSLRNTIYQACIVSLTVSCKAIIKFPLVSTLEIKYPLNLESVKHWINISLVYSTGK